MSGNCFRLFRVVNPVELYHCFGHWLCKKLELRSVGLPLSKFGTDQLCWAEICNLKSLLQTALAPWASLSVELIFFSPLLLLSKTVSSRKLCWAHLWYLLPDIKVDRKWSNSLLRTIFSQKCHFQIISHGQWWTKKFHPFLDSTYQEWMIFAKIGDGPCYYLWNEVCTGVDCDHTSSVYWYSKASRYTASSCTDLAGARFWIGSKKIWDERIYEVKTLSSTVFWSSCLHPIK